MYREFLDFIFPLAEGAGKIQLAYFRGDDLAIRTKSNVYDVVTRADKESEAYIAAAILERWPDHEILGEEGGSMGRAGSDYRWVVDPLDGTTNFIHGFPQYSVSIALAYKGQINQALVYDVIRNEMFTASKGGGAFLNERRIRVTKCLKLDDALIGTGFPFRVFDHANAYMGIFKDFTERTAGIRRTGSAALDLAYVACGRLDGFWEFGLMPWDMAAGSLLISEAGGLISDLSGGEDYLKTGNVVCGSPKVFAQMLQVVDSFRTPTLQS